LSEHSPANKTLRCIWLILHPRAACVVGHRAKDELTRAGGRRRARATASPAPSHRAAVDDLGTSAFPRPCTAGPAIPRATETCRTALVLANPRRSCPGELAPTFMFAWVCSPASAWLPVSDSSGQVTMGEMAAPSRMEKSVGLASGASQLIVGEARRRRAGVVSLARLVEWTLARLVEWTPHNLPIVGGRAMRSTYNVNRGKTLPRVETVAVPRIQAWCGVLVRGDAV
jgi:hypothetical protein